MLFQDGYGLVAQALADVNGASPLPRGLRCSLYTAIDHLREGQAPVQLIQRAERIAVSVHQLEWAIFRQDPDREAELRRDLNDAAANWPELVTDHPHSIAA